MRHPSILWAQRANEVYVTINLPEIVDETVDLTESGMSFTGTSHGLVYEFTLDFYASIKSRKTKQGRYMLCVLEKKNADAPWWPRLTTNKVNFVKTDFAKWKDEDEEDEDVSEDPMYNGMDQFSGMDFSDFGMSGEKEEEEDEEMPALE